MKISKLFHWLYAILMLLPIGLVIFNMLHGLFSPSATSIDIYDFIGYFDSFFSSFDIMSTGLFGSVLNVYTYLLYDLFGIEFSTICYLLAYWTSISIIWLVFDVFMYVPLLVHRWIDKAKIE